jgi:hypothetical protein
MLRDLHQDLRNAGIALVFAGVKGPVRDIMMKNQLVEAFGKESFFDNISEALECYNDGRLQISNFDFQTNLGIKSGSKR